MSNSQSPLPTPSQSAPSFSDGWRERILLPTLLGGIAGGVIGTMSKHRKTLGLRNISATYAANFAIVTGFYSGAREFVRVTRKSEHGDLMNSAVGGFCSGAVLGRLQGGTSGAVRYSIIFAIVGTGVDFATPKLQALAKSYYDSLSGTDLKLPEWSPIKILDEEALAAKREREEKLRAHKAITIRSNES